MNQHWTCLAGVTLLICAMTVAPQDRVGGIEPPRPLDTRGDGSKQDPAIVVSEGGAFGRRTTLGRDERACCWIGTICDGTDPNDPASRCPGDGYCETSGWPCTTDFDCAAGTCSVTTAKACHVDWIDPDDPYHGGEGCPAGEQCLDFERCRFTNCDAYACSDDPTSACTPAYAGDNSDCMVGLCTDGVTACHDDYDCPPGACSVGANPCYGDSDCTVVWWDYCTNPAPETCTGGATCDPLPCVDAALCEVADQPTCEDELGGFWKESELNCNPSGQPGVNMCQQGACCHGVEFVGLVCDDQPPLDDLNACVELGSAVFIPGAACADEPCPGCPMMPEDHCQPFDVLDGRMSTCDRRVGRDFRCADDFTALTSGELQRVCWWPGFAPTAGHPECSDPGLTPPGYWTLRVFEDLGGMPDKGAELGPAGGQDLVADILAPVYGQIWEYSASVGDGVDPINLAQDECYWLEISGEGEDHCVIYWAWSDAGNDYAMQDHNLPDYPHYTAEDAITTDYAFCLDVSMAPGCVDPPPIGGCCLCPAEGEAGDCVEATLDECGLLTDPFGNPGNWHIHHYCTGDGVTPCETDSDCSVLGLGTCEYTEDQCDPNPCSGIPPNDDCVNAIEVFHPDGDPANIITVYYDNRCASTEEGAPTDCDTPPVGDLNFDLWYKYTVPGYGTLVVETCESVPVFDGFGAIYRTSDFVPGSVTCETLFDGTPHDYACNDDGCGAGGPWHFEVPGDWYACDYPPRYEELLIRVGGWWDGYPGNIAWGRGYGFFTIQFIEADCWHWPGEALPAPYPHNRQRNRYLAFDPNPENAGYDVAFKVTLTSVRLRSCDASGSPDVEGWSCRTDADCRACRTNENPCWTAALHCQPGETCDPTGAVCLNDHTIDPANGHHSVGRSWWVGPQNPETGVHLLVSEPYRKVSDAWDNPVVVADCEVVPGGVYAISTVLGMSEWLPLTIVTSAKPDKFWADCVGPLGYHCTGNWRPCTTSADCPVCYNWLLGPTNPNNGSTLTPCTSHADCNACSVSGGPGMYASDCPAGEVCVWTGEWCGFDCIFQWPPPDGFINFHDINAAVFTFSGLPTVTPTPAPNVDLHGSATGDASKDPPNYMVNFNDIGLMVQAFAGYPYPYSDPGDCPDVTGWP